MQQFAEVAGSLNDSEPVNRVFATFAVAKILGLQPDSDVGVDITAGPELRQQQIRELVERIQARLEAEK